MEKAARLIQKIWKAEISCRTWCILTVSVSAAIVLGAALLSFTVDPHYRYRAPFFYDMVYYELYATAPHILKNQDYDLLMIGTSMTRNFFLSDIDAVYGCRSIKLAAAGGTIPDLCKFMDIAVKSKKENLKRIILSLDIYPFNKSKVHYLEFDYLYRDDHWEDYRYLFSRQTFSNMLYLLKRKIRAKKQRAHQSDRNRMFSTEYEGKPYGLKAVMKDALANERKHHTQTPYRPQEHQKNLYGLFLPFLDANPQIPFTVYLPPYHIYTYCQSEHFGEAEELIRQRSAVMRELLKRKNVTLYDYQADKKYVENHDYFSDVQHFSNHAARALLRDLKNGCRKISTPEEVDKNEKELRALIKENMPRYRQHIEQFKRR